MVELVVVNRFRVDENDADAFRRDVHAALGALAQRPGHVDGRVGRNLDDPDLWVLTTTWANVGSYRRALSAYDVKVTAVPLLSRAVDEPSAYETVGDDGDDGDGNGSGMNVRVPRELR